MGMWYHSYCFFSKQECENPFPDDSSEDCYDKFDKLKKEYKRECECGIYLTEEGDMEHEFYEMEELQEGRYSQKIINELQTNQRYHINELIKIFHEGWNLDIIKIMSILEDYRGLELEEDLQFLAIIIQKMRDNGYRYVWFHKIHF